MLLVPTRRRLLTGAAAAALAASLPAAPAQAAGSVRCGAIRWDAWYDATQTGAYSLQSAHALSLAAYQNRAPFFAVQQNANKLLINGATQAIIDAEITYAANAGLKYWAFGYYNGTGNVLSFNVAFQLYQSSSKKNLINWCWTRPLGTELYNDITSGLLAQQMAQSNYEKVLGNRPLLFIQQGGVIGSGGGQTPVPAGWTSSIPILQSQCAAAGIGNPYILIQGMGASPANADITRVSLGADAQGPYAINTPTTNGTYASLDSLAQTYAGQVAAAAPHAIPIAMSGWNTAARNARPENFSGGGFRPMIGLNNGYAAPTPTELANHITAMKAIVAANPTVYEAQSLLIYSWNEFTEGGSCLCPTWTPTGPNAAYLTALTGVL